MNLIQVILVNNKQRYRFYSETFFIVLVFSLSLIEIHFIITGIFKFTDQDSLIILNGPCNSYFRNLPNGRSFRQIWQDNTIFINYSPSLTNGFFGATHSNDKDICVSAWCLDNKNRWMIAATIAHELAHIGGAPGGTSHDAEKAVEKCGFNPQYDPTIIGSIEKLGGYLETIA